MFGDYRRVAAADVSPLPLSRSSLASLPRKSPWLMVVTLIQGRGVSWGCGNIRNTVVFYRPFCLFIYLGYFKFRPKRCRREFIRGCRQSWCSVSGWPWATCARCHTRLAPSAASPASHRLSAMKGAAALTTRVRQPLLPLIPPPFTFPNARASPLALLWRSHVSLPLTSPL